MVMGQLHQETELAIIGGGPGGYVAALVANRKELVHTGILTGILAVMGALSVLCPQNELPLWVNLATVFPIAPCFLLGGLIRKKSKK